MLNKIGQLSVALSLCLMVGGCHSIYNSQYYIPVDNQDGDAQPLSTNDVIRVVVPREITQYVANSDRYDTKKIVGNGEH